ncbi:MAG: tRNA pseudouridine(55) synthase TruB [Candidatus Izemoplasmatales bacterium]|jgi:tRNA pseudouridine55 synthase|nr:tRNA pseudouridine(55) synthase TruB [Candidatus Izemoplasmatales bacterium]
MNGLLIIDKPANITSHDVVNKLRKILCIKRIGHTGTLDPFARGVMVLLIGEATKLSKYFVEKDKSYHAEILIGTKTDSDDVTGEVIDEKSVSHITEEMIDVSLTSFSGKIKQIPPIYSAIKKDGKKMVDLARKHKEMPELEPRDVEIYSIRKQKVSRDGNKIIIEVDMFVSKGTYIRSFARDLGEKLGSVGTLNSLLRTEVGPFSLKKACSLSDISKDNITLIDPLIYLGMPKLVLSDEHAKDVSFGRFLPMSLFENAEDTILYNSQSKAIAIYTYDQQKNIMRMSVLLN